MCKHTIGVYEIYRTICGGGKLKVEPGGAYVGFPPEHYPKHFIPGQLDGGFHDRDNMWMHTDKGRKEEDDLPYQSTFVLEDADMDDHVLVYLSNSARYHDEFLATHKKLELEDPKEAPGYLQLTRKEVEWFLTRGCKWVKVVVPKGSLIIWDPKLIHATCNPVERRKNSKLRFVVYGGWVPKG